MTYGSSVPSEILKEAGQTVKERDGTPTNHYKQILSMKVVHLISIFVVVYVGVEVTLGGESTLSVRNVVVKFSSTCSLVTGWIVTFVIDERGGGASSGYITSGFFGGLTLGRLVLLWLNQKASPM